MGDYTSQFWGNDIQAVMEPGLSDSEKSLRDIFVREYLFDFNPLQAAIRCGFMSKFAEQYAANFMKEPYVLKRIAELKMDTDEEANKQSIKAALLREAHYHGEDSSHSARVSALAKLSAIYGLDKSGEDGKGGTGVMIVPVANESDWENVAQSGQKQLKEDVRT